VEFEQFWEVWPKKVAKKKAELAWRKLTQLEKREAMEALPNHLKYWEIKRTHIDFVPYPASWINAARWEDILDMTPLKKKWIGHGCLANKVLKPRLKNWVFWVMVTTLMKA